MGVFIRDYRDKDFNQHLIFRKGAMCPLYPLHIALLYLCLALPLLLAVVEGADTLAGWRLSFSQAKLGAGSNETDKLRELTTKQFDLLCTNCVQQPSNKYKLILQNEDPNIASVSYMEYEQDEAGMMELDITGIGRDWSLTVNVTGTFLGFTNLRAEVRETDEGNKNYVHHGSDRLDVVVTRSKAKKTASKIFGYSVAALISFAYINMGCALDLEVMKKVLKRPIGPLIGFISQFLFMPICSFILSYIFPFSNTAMKLGLFVTGCSPGGGASNIWTVMFGGNLDLSIVMTAVSTFSAFFMMPLWIFLLGEVIIADTTIVIPYKKILTYGIMLIVPLLLGVSIRKCLPKVAKVLVKILKPMAFFLIVFILVCGIWSQFFMIKLIDWRIALVGFSLPWLGFGFGCMFSKMCRQERKDIIAIAIETGIQNTGMAIFMLWFTLDHPAGDLAAVVPVAVATLTPFPLLTAPMYYNLRKRFCGSEGKEMTELSSEKDKDVSLSLVEGELKTGADANHNQDEGKEEQEEIIA